MLGRAPRGEDRPDLEAVFEAHVDAVFGFFAYAVSRETAEDLTAETFERVIRSWKRFDPSRASAKTWILSIARNLLTDHYRRQKHRRGPSTDEHPGLLDRMVASDPYREVLDADEVAALLAVLSDREREVVGLRFAADLSAAEVAETMGLTEANVHQIASRSLRKLRDVLEATPDQSAQRST